jgi:hypothetical protein
VTTRTARIGLSVAVAFALLAALAACGSDDTEVDFDSGGAVTQEDAGSDAAAVTDAPADVTIPLDSASASDAGEDVHPDGHHEGGHDASVADSSEDAHGDAEADAEADAEGDASAHDAGDAGSIKEGGAG